MKLRLKGSTLRLRLRRSEIETLAATGEVREVVTFARGDLLYSLVLDERATAPEAVMTGKRNPRAAAQARGIGVAPRNRRGDRQSRGRSRCSGGTGLCAHGGGRD